MTDFWMQDRAKPLHKDSETGFKLVSDLTDSVIVAIRKWLEHKSSANLNHAGRRPESQFVLTKRARIRYVLTWMLPCLKWAPAYSASPSFDVPCNWCRDGLAG
jgi:hypothetical protein